MRVLSILLTFIVSISIAQADDKSSAPKEISALEALHLFHESVLQVRLEIKEWLAISKMNVADLKNTSQAAKVCQKTDDITACQQAILELVPYSRFELKDDSIFKLEKDVKTKYKYEMKDGMKAFQLSTALRWLIKQDEYNGVPLLNEVNYSKGYKPFLKAIEEFHKDKYVEIFKAERSMPAL
jgi:hypothetical protein